MITVLYFARIREAVDLGEEQLVLDSSCSSVKLLKKTLAARGGAWEVTLSENQSVLVAVNQEMVGVDHKVVDGDEVAFFPPVTGG
ncbi:MAG: molybdopterin converting factor subunit 1 [Pseudomonadales bacterium]|nr:molybdopterin converting factor subunit 1 [Pseudomonadales bacterium]